MRSDNATPPGSRSATAPSASARPAISVVLPAPSRPSTEINIASESDKPRWRAGARSRRERRVSRPQREKVDARKRPPGRGLGSETVLATLEPHPHAKAVLGAALKGEPAHAYLLHGPAGSGKREAARAFAGELLARGARDPQN